MYVSVSRYKTYTRVRIMDKTRVGGKWLSRLVEHIGTAHNDTELALLREKAAQRIVQLKPQLSLLDGLTSEAVSEDSHLVVSGSFAAGLWRIIGGIYDHMNLPDDILKYLVLARIALPKSKLVTARYLGDNLSFKTSASTIYRYMDTLNKDELVARLLDYAQQRAKANTGVAISVVFYDVTTLYFETDDDDLDTGSVGNITPGLRKKGYSKDHRFDLPQVVVGLTVDNTGFPLDFQVYEGDTYEGHTLLSGVKTIQKKLLLENTQLTVIADAGMLSAANLDELERQGYHYIVGARIRSLAAKEASKITSWDYAKMGTLDTAVNGRRLIVTYSEKRDKRSKHNRERLITRLREKLAHGQVVKKSKYVVLDEVDGVETPKGSKKRKGSKQTIPLKGHIDEAKLEADALFDGLKGYVTDTKLTPTEVISHYGTLINVEKSFRMSKSDLQARPTFHYKRERIIAHLTICVCSLAVLREFERRIQNSPMPNLWLSIALEKLLSIREYQLKLPNGQTVKVYSELSETQELLLRI